MRLPRVMLHSENLVLLFAIQRQSLSSSSHWNLGPWPHPPGPTDPSGMMGLFGPEWPRLRRSCKHGFVQRYNKKHSSFRPGGAGAPDPVGKALFTPISALSPLVGTSSTLAGAERCPRVVPRHAHKTPPAPPSAAPQGRRSLAGEGVSRACFCTVTFACIPGPAGIALGRFRLERMRSGLGPSTVMNSEERVYAYGLPR